MMELEAFEVSKMLRPPYLLTVDFEQAAFGQAKTCPQRTPGARHFGMATCSSHSLLKAQRALSEPYVHTQHSMHLKKPGQVFLEVL